MTDAPHDEPTLGEKMNSALYLAPSFAVDKPGLAGALSDEIDETTVRAQQAVDRRRAEAADAEISPDEP